MYSVVCLASAIMAFTLGTLALWYYRLTSYARPLGLLLLAGGLYAFGYAFEIMQANVDWFFLWLRVEYFGLAFVGGFFLWFTLAFTDSIRKEMPLLGILLGVSAFFLVAVLTNNLHHRYYSFIAVDYRGPFPTAHLGRGILYILHNLWILTTFALSGIFLLFYTLKARPIFRFRAVMPIFAVGVCLGVFLVYTLRAIPWSLDINPLALTVNGIFLALAIARMEFFGISPVARDRIFESMQDGVVLTNSRGMVVDFNTTAMRFIPGLSSRWLGQKLSVLLPDLERYTSSNNPLEIEPLVLEYADGTQSYEVRKIPVIGKRGQELGTAWSFREITERQRLLHRLQDAADRDSLTGVYNRRKWAELTETELRRAKRYQRPLALLFFDIDHFKVINDTAGHEVGDEVLIRVAHLISLHLRESDLLGRIGGDEFVILLAEVKEEQAFHTASRLLTLISQAEMKFGEHQFRVTLSAGLTFWNGREEVSLEQLLREADRALYQAKNSGRNRIARYSPGQSSPNVRLGNPPSLPHSNPETQRQEETSTAQQ